ncbi:lipid-A-disaccharide synthase-related protein [Leptolyngbya ohadii]|uniref:lipid-A-disaccharide synthase-related protein n=1 Tax=Leptolyngbya ohadii TaxID=1962290 RepID=UPI000B5A07F8|nr:lipid-A-disaccharide synthase-related protein [Leptolyngbya ohadii]
MRLLCLSNGHGEDTIALRIVQALQQQSQSMSQPLEIAALPVVGEGQTYQQQGIPIVGTVKAMPSGGFVYMDGKQLARDIRGGLLQLTRTQMRTVRTWAQEGGFVLAVGDIVPLLFAWWSRVPYAFIATAKSEYYLRDEHGLLPRQSWFERLESWSGSVFLPWERWLMSRPHCRAVFPRDRLTTHFLKRWKIPAFDLGNPMMDGLEPAGQMFRSLNEDSLPLTIALLPGSRAPEAYENWGLIVQSATALQKMMPDRSLLFVAATVPWLDREQLQHTLRVQGWRQQTEDSFEQTNARLILTQAFNDCLHQADLGIAMAGTATEQLVGLGKPVVSLPGKGPQFTFAFAEAQTRLLGCSVTMVQRPQMVPPAVTALLQDPDRLYQIQQNGQQRMGTGGAAARIATHLLREFQ